MRNRVGSGHGTPTRWGRRGPDDADPTSGRHAFDQDAALTPIFTTLRRGGWRSRPQGAPRALWVVPDPVERYPDDPPTMLLPIVPPLRAVDAEPGEGWEPRGATTVDPYVPAPYVPASYAPAPAPSAPPESPAETTAWWQPPVAAHRLVDDADDADDTGTANDAYDDYYDYDYTAAPYPASSDPGVAPAAAYGADRYDPEPQHLLRHPASSHPGSYGDGSYGDGSYGDGSYGDGSHGTGPYGAVVDSGRHHVRLAPAGW